MDESARTTASPCEQTPTTTAGGADDISGLSANATFSRQEIPSTYIRRAVAQGSTRSQKVRQSRAEPAAD